MTIGEKIKELRIAKGMPLEELGFRCGISRQRMQAIEAGTGYPLIPTLMRVSKALGCSLYDLINEPLGLASNGGKNNGADDDACANAVKCPFFKKKI